MFYPDINNQLDMHVRIDVFESMMSSMVDGAKGLHEMQVVATRANPIEICHLNKRIEEIQSGTKQKDNSRLMALGSTGERVQVVVITRAQIGGNQVVRIGDVAAFGAKTRGSSNVIAIVKGNQPWKGDADDLKNSTAEFITNQNENQHKEDPDDDDEGPDVPRRSVDHGGGDESGSSHGSSNGGKKTKTHHSIKHDWLFDSRLFTTFASYDGVDVVYFQQWFSFLKSEMVSRWETWETILDELERAGEHKVGPLRIVNRWGEDVCSPKAIKTTEDEFLRIVSGSTRGVARTGIIQVGESCIFVAFMRMIAKGERNAAAIRELKSKMGNPAKANMLAAYESAITEWHASISKPMRYAGHGAVPQSTGLFEIYLDVDPFLAEAHAMMIVDREVDVEKFQVDMETRFNMVIRTVALAPTPAAVATAEAPKEEEQGEQYTEALGSMLNLLKGKNGAKGAKCKAGANLCKGKRWNGGDEGSQNGYSFVSVLSTHSLD